MAGPLTHLDKKGHARMVDVGDKESTRRTAIARADVLMSPQTLSAVNDGRIAKGDVLAVARIAGITGGKKTPDLIPLTHPIGLDSLKVELTTDLDLPGVRIEATATTHGKTGVEMEALTAASIAALTVYDMLKSLEKGILVSNIRLTYKDGGKSGKYEAE
ncbi:cyclic pyranopterin monophosphate synthase MoaC [bacterium]|nr:MAG: cyclic pyranopterin monophosphate synthase MoaC [bacterium]